MPTSPPEPAAPRRVGDLLRFAIARLAAAGLERPGAEAVALAVGLLGLDRAALLAHPERPVDPVPLARFLDGLERRAAHCPLAYLTGRREFYGRELLVDPRVLIPRPETELLVEAALERLSDRRGRPLVVDVGTGSGCLAITLALEAPHARIVAVDRSADALAVAAINLRRFGLAGRLSLVQGDLLTWLGRRPELVVANLPYVPREALAELPPDVRDYEPLGALDGGPGGTALIERLLAQAAALAVPGLLLEVDARHADAVAELARRVLSAHRVEIKPDLAGRPRLVSAEAEPAARTRRPD